MSTEGTLALAAISGLVGAGLRQKTIDDLRTQAYEDTETIVSLVFRLNKANQTIQQVTDERDSLAQDKVALIAEVARLRELVPPEEDA